MSGLAVTRVGNWNVVIDDRMKDGRVIGLLMTVLFGRAEDEWLVARYEGSSDLLDWGHLNADGQMLVEMLEIAKRTSVRWTTVWILCTRISSLMLHRPQRLRDAFAWKEELARRKLSAS